MFYSKFTYEKVDKYFDLSNLIVFSFNWFNLLYQKQKTKRETKGQFHAKVNPHVKN